MKKILLIEDNPDVRENTSEMLEFANYDVAAAENGRVGVKMARQKIPDLILCDIMMPELDGYGVLNILSRDPKTAGIPFIFLTAKADRSDMRKGMSMGADDYITKPFEEMELLDAVEMRLKRAQIVRKDFDHTVEGLNAFFDEARGEHALSKLSEGRRIRSYGAKENVFLEGDLPRDLFYIVKGKVKTWRMNDDGKELVTGLYKAGEFFGFLSMLTNQAYSQSAACLEKCELAMIPKEEFEELMWKNRDVAYRFVKMLANSIQEKEEKLLHLAYDSVRARVAEVLLNLREKYKEETQEPFRIRISRDDLASMAGTATESLIRTLSEFRNDKLIENSGREIILLDPEGLEKVKRFW